MRHRSVWCHCDLQLVNRNIATNDSQNYDLAYICRFAELWCMFHVKFSTVNVQCLQLCFLVATA